MNNLESWERVEECVRWYFNPAHTKPIVHIGKHHLQGHFVSQASESKRGLLVKILRALRDRPLIHHCGHVSHAFTPRKRFPVFRGK